MTEPLNENQLKADFRHLREIETQAAPDFRRSLAGVPQVEPRRRFRPAMQFAMSAVVLVAIIAVFLNPGRDQTIPATAETALPSTEEAALAAALEMPTDFLLDTPWFELARTTPDFDFQFPQYDIPEDLSDEI
ncbi:MAG: hypothetical protein HKN57_10175 [Xanthomonadales bacterium]|nr:hypothetical protein [Gammaproteobacteria bacterium]MBT8054549.1 hypothetical protein [Gammaproteobacteria bacterium]NND57611.1 hypothetical protein [Xanthomonadales bacterium]NNK51335.1 hypothetical protein [Xanthomonadales bacterium]